MVLEFLDGSTAACDILVGCDGIKSAVRSVLYHSLVKEAELAGDIAQAACFRREAIPQWSGYIAYRALFPRDRLEAACPGHPALTRSLLVCYISLHAGRTDKSLSQCFGKNKVERLAISVQHRVDWQLRHPAYSHLSCVSGTLHQYRRICGGLQVARCYLS